MQKETAEKLVKAQDKAYMDGYRIRIYDSYRPLSVQKNLYEANPPELSAFVAKPSKNERHSIGLALDIGLSDLNGVEIKMPSEWDEFNEKAYINYTGGDKTARAHRDYLIKLMNSVGFTVYSKEWWHYNAPMKSGMEAFDFEFREFTEAREKFYSGQ